MLPPRLPPQKYPSWTTVKSTRSSQRHGPDQHISHPIHHEEFPPSLIPWGPLFNLFSQAGHSKDLTIRWTYVKVLFMYHLITLKAMLGSVEQHLVVGPSLLVVQANVLLRCHSCSCSTPCIPLNPLKGFTEARDNRWSSRRIVFNNSTMAENCQLVAASRA